MAVLVATLMMHCGAKADGYLTIAGSPAEPPGHSGARAAQLRTPGMPLNAAGVAVGGAGGGQLQATRWDGSGNPTILTSTGGPTDDSMANAINSSGVAVGYSGQQAIRWGTDGAVTVLN